MGNGISSPEGIVYRYFENSRKFWENRNPYDLEEK